MNITVTGGIKVTIELFYQPDLSSGIESQHIFAYQIKITNKNKFPVKIEGTGFTLIDTGRKPKYTEKYGIYGRFDTIYPAESYSFNGAISIQSDIAKWMGYILMKNLNNDHYITANIPVVELYSPDLLN